MNNLEKAALYMGYREIKQDFYLKPIGYSCLKIHGDEFRISSIFKANEEFHVWSSLDYEKDLTVEEYVSLIKEFETYHLYSGKEETSFEFVTPEQLYLCN